MKFQLFLAQSLQRSNLWSLEFCKFSLYWLNIIFKGKRKQAVACKSSSFSYKLYSTQAICNVPMMYINGLQQKLTRNKTLTVGLLCQPGIKAHIKTSIYRSALIEIHRLVEIQLPIISKKRLLELCIILLTSICRENKLEKHLSNIRYLIFWQLFALEFSWIPVNLRADVTTAHLVKTCSRYSPVSFIFHFHIVQDIQPHMPMWKRRTCLLLLIFKFWSAAIWGALQYRKLDLYSKNKLCIFQYSKMSSFIVIH